VTKLVKRLRPEVLHSFAFPLDGHGASGRGGYTLVPADAASIDRFRAAHPRQVSETKAQLMKDRARSDDQDCWLIVDNAGRTCGYCHVARTQTVNTRINHVVRVGPSQAYFFDDYVVRKYRGRGLHTFSIAERARLLRAQGLTEGITTITRTNAPSLRTYGKFGLRRFETLLYVLWLGRTLRLPRRRSGG
jgi:GNAT superfamily N-acetyltransferase